LLHKGAKILDKQAPLGVCKVEFCDKSQNSLLEGLKPDKLLGEGDGGRWIPLDRTQLDQLVQSVTGSLASLGFYKQPGREEQEAFFRDVFSRAGLTKREGVYLGDIFAKAARLAQRSGMASSD
jgi:hypothetical protein